MKINQSNYYKDDFERGRLLIYCYRYAGVKLADMLHNRTKLSPNNLSIIGFVFLLGSCALFILAGYLNSLIAAIFFQIFIILDYTDGRLARIKGTTGFLGMWLDSNFGYLSIILLHLSISYGVYRYEPNIAYIVFGFLISSFILTLENISTSYRAASDQQSSVSVLYQKHGIVKLFDQVRYSLPVWACSVTIFALLGRMNLYLPVFCLYIVAYYLLVAVLLGISMNKTPAGGDRDGFKGDLR